MRGGANGNQEWLGWQHHIRNNYIPDPPTLPAPLGLGYEIQGSSVVLTWDPDDSTQIMYYSVEKSLDSSFTIDVEVHYALSNNFIDTDVEENTQYFYRVSYYGTYQSEYSEVLSVTFVGPTLDPCELQIQQCLF